MIIINKSYHTIYVTAYLLSIVFRINAQCNYPANIEFAALGYNIMKGNPYTTGGVSDKGFYKAIFDFSNCSNPNKWNGNNVPNGATVVGVATCSMEQSYRAMAGSQAYKSYISEAVSVEGSANEVAWKASFSANVDYQNVHSTTSSEQSVVISSHSQCGVYQVTLNTPNNGPDLGKNFRIAVEEMPLSYGDSKNNTDWFWRFIDTDFGTHYLPSTLMGGRYGKQYIFTANSYSSFDSSNIDIQAAASYSTAMAGGSVNSVTKDQQQQGDDFKKASSSSKEYYVGGNTLPVDGNSTAWQQSLYYTAQPMSFKLESLLNLLNGHYFPFMNSTQLTMKRTALQTALTQYCQQVEDTNLDYKIDCNGLPDDPPLPSRSIFGGIYSVGGNGYTAYNNPYTKAQNCPEKQFTSYPLSIELHHPVQSYICLNSSQKTDGMKYFGGSFGHVVKVHSNSGSCITNNTLTGGCSCPNGFEQNLIGYETRVINSGGKDKFEYKYQNYMCYNKSMDVSQSIIGGFYMSGSAGNVANLYTNTQSCPQGFNHYPVSSKCPHGNLDKCLVSYSTQWVCISNIYNN